MGGSDHGFRGLFRPVQIGTINLLDGMLCDALGRLLSFAQALRIERNIHPAAQPLLIVQRIKHGLAMPYQN
jgi:hypothetical protein